MSRDIQCETGGGDIKNLELAMGEVSSRDGELEVSARVRRGGASPGLAGL